MSDPFFSVIIPTKNRSHLVGQAIQSVLNQSFSDFEIVVSDNDDSEVLTRDAVAAFSDPRIKYIRTTGTLSMPDNWELGLNYSTGLYVMILEDKQVFYPDALETIHSVLSNKAGTVVVTWDGDHIDDTETPPVYIKYFGSGRVFTFAPDEMLARYTSTLNEYFLPRMINSCVSRSLTEYVRRETPLKRFFVPMCPDLSAGFIQLNYADMIAHIDRSLFIWGGVSLSAGRAITLNTDAGKRSIEDCGDPSRHLNQVPILSLSLPKNFIINDYRRLAKILGGRLARYPISPGKYFLACYKDIELSRQFSVDMTEEITQWKKHSRSLALTVQLDVRWWIFLYLLRQRLKKWSITLWGRDLVFRVGKRRRVIPTHVNALEITIGRFFNN